MAFSAYLQAGLEEAAKKRIASYEGERSADSLAAIERLVQESVDGVGRCVVKGWVEAQAAKYPAMEVRCGCGKQARYVRQREGMSLTLHGKVRYRRAYYSCECGRGCYPLDDQLDIAPGQMSAELRTVAALFGVQEAYASSSIRNACQSAGEAVLAAEAAVIQASHDLQRQTATQRGQIPAERMYLSVDGFQAPFEDGWHELKAGVLWRTDANRRAFDQHYFVDTVSSDGFADLVWAKAWEHGADLARQLVIVADGSTWIWNMAKRLFPHAIHIVDAFHAASYLGKIAANAFGEATPEATAWFEHRKALLLDGHLFQLMRDCLALRSKAPAAVDAARHYFANHRTRLRYPKYRARGLQIGSRVMESACKQTFHAAMRHSPA